MSSVVPFAPQDKQPITPAGSSRGPLENKFLMMAMAQMHKEGRLVKPQTKAPSGKQK